MLRAGSVSRISVRGVGFDGRVGAPGTLRYSARTRAKPRARPRGVLDLFE
jgi:hypothetical protein